MPNFSFYRLTNKKHSLSVNSLGKTKQKINDDGKKVLLKNFKHKQQFQNAKDYKIKVISKEL